MKTIMFKSAVLTIALAITGIANALMSSETKDAAQRLGASHYSEVSFEKGMTALTPAQKNEIRAAIADAKKVGEIEEVKVLAWADTEYPAEGSKPLKGDIELAKKRSKELKNFISDELKVSDVDVYNMAERPNRVEKLFRTADARVKGTTERSGAAPRTAEETGLFGWKGQSSKALIMIFHE